jgi:hypothetical protein
VATNLVSREAARLPTLALVVKEGVSLQVVLMEVAPKEKHELGVVGLLFFGYAFKVRAIARNKGCELVDYPSKVV